MLTNKRLCTFIYVCIFCVREAIEKFIDLWQTESLLCMTIFTVLRIWEMFCGLDFLSHLKQMLRTVKLSWLNINTGEIDSAVSWNLGRRGISCLLLLKCRKIWPEMSLWLLQDWGYLNGLQKSMSKRWQKLKFDREGDPNTQIGRFIPHHLWGSPLTVH